MAILPFLETVILCVALSALPAASGVKTSKALRPWTSSVDTGTRLTAAVDNNAKFVSFGKDQSKSPQ